MPNGESKNWIRFLGALEGFYIMYGRWPEVIHMPPFFIRDLQEKLSEADLNKLQAKIKLVRDQDNPFCAYDDKGNEYDYSRVRGPIERPAVRAIDWLEINEPQYED